VWAPRDIPRLRTVGTCGQASVDFEPSLPTSLRLPGGRRPGDRVIELTDILLPKVAHVRNAGRMSGATYAGGIAMRLARRRAATSATSRLSRDRMCLSALLGYRCRWRALGELHGAFRKTVIRTAHGRGRCASYGSQEAWHLATAALRNRKGGQERIQRLEGTVYCECAEPSLQRQVQ
jgi:hypothetical protein